MGERAINGPYTGHSKLKGGGGGQSTPEVVNTTDFSTHSVSRKRQFMLEIV